MKFEIQAGATIETVTPTELREFFAAWRDELRRGVKLRHFTASVVAVSDAFTIDGPSNPGVLGPNKGFIWKLLSVAFGGNGFTQGTDAVSIFIGDTAASRLVASGVTRQHTFAPNYLVGGEELSFSGAATADAEGLVIVSGWAVEAPDSMIQAVM